MTLVYLAIAWAVGIWLARWAWSVGLFGCSTPPLWAWGGMIALAVTALVVTWRKQAVRLPAVCLLLLIAGAARYQLSPFTPCFTPQDLAFYNGTLAEPAWATVTGIVQQPPETRDTRLRVRVAAQSLLLNEQTSPVQGDALFTIDRIPGVRTGDRITVRGRLETPPIFTDFDYREYLARRGVYTLIQQPEVRVLQHDAGHWFWSRLYAVRAAAQQVIARLLPEPEAALLTGILLGVESGIDPDLYDQFNRTGVSHIIVISGFNITIIAGILTSLFARLLGARRAFSFVVLGIVLYVLLVGADAAVLRAGLMGVLVVLASYLNRQSLAIVSLFAAGLLMTLLNPLTLWDVGFQLSFMATLSLVLFATPMTQRFEAAVNRRLPAGLAPTVIGFLNDALIITLAATILTLPLIAYYFGRVSIVSPLTNLLVLPAQPAVMIWGGLATLIGLPAGWHPALQTVLWPVARALALIPWLCLHWTVAVVQVLAALPFAATTLHVNVFGLWSYFGLLALLAASGKARLPVIGNRLQRLRAALTTSRTTSLAASALLVVGLLFWLALRSQPDGRLHVHFLDLGEERGEAVLIVTPDGQQVLLDGGSSPTALLSALGQHLPFYDRTLELVVLTHAGDDRLGGLVGLTERLRVQQVWQTPFPYPSTAYASWLRELRTANVDVLPAAAGARLTLGHGVALDVLSPGAEPVLGKDGELELAENGLVLRLSWGDASFLLLGDVPAAVQDDLADRGLVQPSTVVKLAQGGAVQGFSPALLAAAQPQQAVVFVVSDDRFRALAGSVESAWLAQVGETGWQRTDLTGGISFTSDGHTVWVER